jgi:hypothetical protein
MRTKTLLIASAALAVGILTSSAQTFSQNIVGYVNSTIPYNGSTPSSHGWANVANPLDLSGNNTLTNLFYNPVVGGPGGPNGGTGPLDFSLIYFWNGAGFTIYTIDSDYASGLGDVGDNDTVPVPPTVNPGSLCFILNIGGNISTPTTNTMTGTVHVDTLKSGSQSVGQTTNVLHLGLNYVASKLPVGGGLDSALQLQIIPGGNAGPNGGTGALDFSIVYIPNIVNGAFNGYTIYTVDSDYASGFGDIGDNEVFVEPTVPVGVGFIVDYKNVNGAGSTYNWIQAL